MKCKGREKLLQNRHDEIKYQYGMDYADLICKALCISLADNFGFRLERIGKAVQIFYRDFGECLNMFKPDVQYRTDKKTHTKREMTDWEMDQEVCYDMALYYERELDGIFVPDLDADLYMKDEYISRYRRKEDGDVICMRGSWYENTAKIAGKAYILQMLLMLHTYYGFGAVRLKRFYDTVIEIHTQWLEAFIGEIRISDCTINKVQDRLTERLDSYGIKAQLTGTTEEARLTGI